MGLVYLKSEEIEEISMCQNISHPIHCPLEDGQTGCFLDDQNQINFVFTFALFFAASTFKGLFLLWGLALIDSAAKNCEVLFVLTEFGWLMNCV